MVVYFYNLSTQETEAGGSKVQSQLVLHSEIQSQNVNMYTYMCVCICIIFVPEALA
jgi:hypothetical protein